MGTVYHSWFSRSRSTSITTKGSAESPICWTFCCSCKKSGKSKTISLLFCNIKSLPLGTSQKPKHKSYTLWVPLSCNSHFLFTATLIKTPFYDSHRDLSVKAGHNTPIYDECQTQQAKDLTLLWERAHWDNSNDTPQSIGGCQVDFPLLWIKDYPGLS